MSSPKNPAERRRSPRRAILSSFSLFAVVPSKGVHRLAIHDLSEHGIGFEFDIEGENPADFPVKPGDRLELQLYLNQSLYLPLSIEIKRVEPAPTTRRVGADFTQKSSPGFKALSSFIQMLDGIADAARLA